MFSQGSTVQKACDVCVLLDNDHSIKPVEWCSACQAWVCEKDRHDWQRRMAAAAKKHLGWGRAV